MITAASVFDARLWLLPVVSLSTAPTVLAKAGSSRRSDVSGDDLFHSLNISP